MKRIQFSNSSPMKDHFFAKQFLALCCGLLIMGQLSAKEVDPEEPVYPIYYKETKYALETIDKLPRDTSYIHDTLVVSNIDGFLKQYNCNLKQFAERYGAAQSMMDSLNNESETRLYYNYFLLRDSTRKISNRFMIKEFRVLPDTMFWYQDLANDFEQVKDPKRVRKEILFSCDMEIGTEQFLKNHAAIRRTISALFTEMQRLKDRDSIKIEGINLYFPYYSFKEKRAMTQFVKSFRIFMDLSEDFRFPTTRLTVTFQKKKDKTDDDFSYCLLQEASEVLFLEGISIDSCYVKATRVTNADKSKISLRSQILSHFYIARFYTGNKYQDFNKVKLRNFSEQRLNQYMEIDYPENNWEVYALVLAIIVIAILLIIVSYFLFIPFSFFINQNLESVMLISIMVLLEIIALLVIISQRMCREDQFPLFQENLTFILLLPLIVILIIPLLKGMSRKRRIP